MNRNGSYNQAIPWEISDQHLGQKFKEFGIRQGWWDTCTPIILAVSGGSDSMALLWFFRSFWPGKVIVAHLEHGIRDHTSLRDAAFVEEVCHSGNITFEVSHVSVPDEKYRGESIEEAGRRIRYSFLESIMEKYHASRVATAHTSDDVAETVFMNLARGTGPFGLAGIPEIRGNYIRPLISFYREELREILRARGISWCEDETNEDVSYLRNRVRIEVLPFLAERINSRMKEHLVALASQMNYVKEREIGTARNLIDWFNKDLPFSILSLDHNCLRKLSRDTLSMVIRESGASLGLSTLSRHRTENLLDLVKNSGRWRFQWEGSIEVFAGQGYIAFADRVNILNRVCGPFNIYPDSFGTSFTWNHWKIEVEKCEQQGITSRSGSNSVILPFFEEALEIMSVEDHLSGSGSDTYAKRVPWWLRKVWPVFCLGSTISWLPFYGLVQTDEQERPSRNETCIKIRAITQNVKGCS